MEGKYLNIIIENLLLLNSSSGSLVIMNTPFTPASNSDSKSGIYCQFIKYGGGNDVILEAVSHNSMKIVSKKLRGKFFNLGFELLKYGNYSKDIIIDSPDKYFDIAYEVKYIFEEIYELPSQSIYDICLNKK